MCCVLEELASSRFCQITAFPFYSCVIYVVCSVCNTCLVFVKFCAVIRRITASVTCLVALYVVVWLKWDTDAMTVN